VRIILLRTEAAVNEAAKSNIRVREFVLAALQNKSAAPDFVLHLCTQRNVGVDMSMAKANGD
jgi:hypothetical protein